MALLQKARTPLLPALTAAGLFILAYQAPVSAANLQVVSKTRPAAATQLVPAGRLPGSQNLRLAIGLPVRNPAELDELLRQLYDPASPNFHQWLTPQQLAARFGATEENCQAVRNWAEARRLNVRATHPNRLIIDIEGSVGDIESALHIALRTYNHPTENRTFFAPDAEPSLDLAVPILTISGLDDFALPQPRHRVKPLDAPGTITPRAGSGPSGSYMGGDFRAAYVPGTTLDGTGQTVGLLQFDGFNNNDILSYESQASLPNVPITVVPIDGGVSNPGSGNSEVCLDIEMVIAMAPGLSRVYVYEAPNPSPWVDLLSRMQTDNLSKQLSCSWGGGSPNASAENIFKLMSGQGQSFYNATGDSDAFVSAIPFPSDSTNITQVGGTTLSTTGPLGSYVSERAWNWGLVQGSYVGSSGGVSTFYKIPNYQVPVSMALNQGSGTMRNVPDVALTGDNVYVRYNSGSAGAFGGTSCAAPLWAGFTALVNQKAAANGLTAIGFMNPPVYSIGLGANYLSNFHDVTTGSNTWASSSTKYYATTGFDLCTGWGTPTVNLINALAGPAGPSLGSNSLTLSAESCANSAVDPGETVTMSFGLINNGSAPTTNLVATLQASGGVTSPSGAQTYGALALAGGSATRAFTFTANGSCGGTVTASLQLQDGSKNLGTLPFSIRLGSITAGTPLNQAFDSLATPALPSGWTSALVSGSQANWVTTTASSSSAPNAAFITDSASLGENALVTPVFPIGSASAQLTFRHNYNLEVKTKGFNTTYYDGGVLEISIGGGAFTDIISAGGSFVSGGYNATLASGNPIASREAWGGNSAGWVTTTVDLPASAVGQNVQLRWACAVDADNANGGVGWYVDSVSISDTVLVCCSGNTAPAFTTQPTNQTVIAGGSTSLVAAASGSPSPGYQWFLNGTNLLAGKTAATLLLTNIQPSQAGGYSVSAGNSAGTVTSLVAQLTVVVPPSITGQPTNQTALAGSSAGFGVTATGTLPLAYQWRLFGTNLNGATGSTLSLPSAQPAQAGPYTVVVSNVAGMATSSVAQLTVLVPPSITGQPTNQNVIVGSNATFNVTAAGTAPLGYQWRLFGTNLTGATGSTLSLASVQPEQAGPYAVVVSNVAGMATSSVAQLTVLVPPSITGQPTNQNVIVGSNATFNVTAGGTAPLGYQWRLFGTNLTGATASTLALANIQSAQAGPYAVVVSNVAGMATSSVAQLTVLVPPSITGQPTNQSVVAGSNTAFSVTAAGTAPLGYQWRLFGTNLNGATGSTLSLANVQPEQAGPYAVVVSNVAGMATSSVAQLTVLVPPSITSQPTNQNVIVGASTAFNVTAAGTAPLGYQWRLFGTNLNSATGSTLSLASVQPEQAGPYAVVVSNIAGMATSSVAQLTVLVPPSITSQPTNQNVIVGASTAFDVTAAGTAPLGYQWRLFGTNLNSATGSTLSLASVQPEQAGPYAVVVSNVAGMATSSVAQLTVLVPPSITGQPTNQNVIVGSNATFNVTAGGTSPLGYQWRLFGTNLNGATGSTLSLPSAQPAQAGPYTVVVSNVAGMATSSVAQLTVLVPPSITGQPTNQNVIAGASTAFNVTAAGTAPLGYQWRLFGTNLNSATGSTLSLASVQPEQAGPYAVVVSNVAGMATSSIAQLTVLVPPSITTQPLTQTALPATNVTFHVAATGTAPLDYQWSHSGTNLPGANLSSLSLSNVQLAQAGPYNVVVSNVAGMITSSIANLRLLFSPTILDITRSGSTASISFQTLNALDYTLEYKEAFDDPVWTLLPPASTGTGGLLILQDTNSPPFNRFYRIRCE